MVGLPSTSLWAEGSKDFVTYPGYRLFLDTRDDQQLKVFANVGETINVGASHVGLSGGFIRVYRPDGTLAATFDNTGTTTGLGIINNNVQEMAGPTGGGSTNGQGYIPGTVTVGAGQAGVWTVIFDFSQAYSFSSFTNILNSAAWTRAANQPDDPNFILAWDITVTTGGAGNTGGVMREGRVFTNEHISVLSGNSVTTSPIFYVLTEDGFQYQVNINNADPFRFPISSNSLGLVTGDQKPIYKSKFAIPNNEEFRRSDDPNSWTVHPDSIYLYEPQAQDSGVLINNKIFFNLPDPNMPASALVTDFYRGNTHSTWLYNTIDDFTLNNFSFVGSNPGGFPCATNVLAFGKGGWFVLQTNLGGSITLQLDLNNNGSYNDPVDVELTGALVGGIDSLFWNGHDGLGNPITVQDSFEFNYTGVIKYGELHIALDDVEGNTGGVTFQWLNVIPGQQNNLFYYDHSDVNGPVSGGGTPGNALPTTLPYTYSVNTGNNKYLDQWFFIEYPVSNTPYVINVVQDCNCDNNTTPALSVVTGGGAYCSGNAATLSATNNTPGIGDLTYNWTGPNGFTFTEKIGDGETSTVTIDPLTEANEGTYQVIAQTSNGCADTLTFNVVVNPTPVISAIAGGGTVCSGTNVTLTATNSAPGIANMSYVWSGPNNFSATGTVAGNGTITATIPAIPVDGQGMYSVVVTSDQGCEADPVTVDVNVNPTPVLTATGGGNFCQDANTTIVVSNTQTGVTTMTCTMTGPNGFFTQSTVPGNQPFQVPLTGLDNSFEGIYTIICVSNLQCESAPQTVSIDINATPQINGASPNGDFCVGEDVTLTAQNVITGTGPITYTWTGPNFQFTGNGPELGPFDAIIPNIQLSNAGVYTLVLETAGGCQSVPQTVTIGVVPSPVITNVMGGGDACLGQDVILSATNSTASITQVTWQWVGPNGQVSSGISDGVGPYIGIVEDVDSSDIGTYTLTLVSNAGCAAEPVSVDLNVVPGLNVVDLTPDANYCEGDEVLLSASNTVASGNITYTWTGPNGNILISLTTDSDGPFNYTIPALSAADTGIYILNLQSEGGCQAGPIPVFVGLHPTANIESVSGGDDYCEGATIVLSGIGSGTATNVIYTWIGPNNYVHTDTAATAAGPFICVIDSATIANSGVYSLVITTPEGCQDGPSTVSVAVFAVPVITGLPTDTVLCENDTLTLCGGNAITGIASLNYTWTAPNGQTFTGTGNGDDDFCVTYMPAGINGSGPYVLVLNNNGCESEPDTVNITFLPAPVMSPIQGSGTYCEGDTAVLWFVNTNPEIDSFYYTCNIGDTTVTIAAGGADTVFILVTEADLVTGNSVFVCCSIESFAGCVSDLYCGEVIFVPAPDADVADETSVCEGDPLLLDGDNLAQGTGTVTYTWTRPNGAVLFTGTANWNGPFPATDPNPVSGEYCLVISSQTTNGECSSEPACVEVTVSPRPFVSNGINGGGNVCQGDNVTLSATISIADGTDIAYQWTFNGTPIEVGVAPSGTTLTLDLSDIQTAQGGEYCLELVSQAGCESDPITCTTVTVGARPTILTVTGGGNYCEGVDVQLNGTGAAGPGPVTYTWTGPNFTFTGTAPTAAGPFPATVGDIQVNQGGVYTLVVTYLDCSSEPATVVVNVNPMPEITNVSGGGSFCPGDQTTISFTIDPSGAASVDFELTGPNGLDSAGTVTALTVISLPVTVTSSTAGTYSLQVTSDQGCEAEPATVTVTLQEPTPATLSAVPNPLCPGDELTLTTSVQTGTNVSYEWYLNGNLLQTTTTNVLVIQNPQSGDYSVIGFSGGCSSESQPVSVLVLSTPQANDDAFQGIQDVNVQGNILNNDNASGGTVTITVVTPPSNGDVTINADGSIVYVPDAGFSGQDQFTYRICLTDCPDLCDEATVTINLTPLDIPCVVPNVITPNGDNTNDVLIIKCVDDNLKPNNSLRVFNRWGDEIFVAEPYNNDWDGTYGNDKKELPAATYYYLFKEDKNTDEVKAGYITVVR
jgi:gliding motility-associated-like protein